ncbi:MAG: tetratricopeptide repeat protein [Candidatus Babeliales bacterium]|nr:tetratricopeptide repeat protein [Candidatus Babeliales bacterium]
MLKKIFFILLLCTSSYPITTDMIQQGTAYLNEQNLDAAYTCFCNALVLDLNQEQLRIVGNSLLTIGNNYYNHAHMEKAAKVFEKLVTLFPTSPAVQFNLGYTLIELTQYRRAQECFKIACSLKPETPEFCVALATALLATGDYQQGWPLYEYRWQLPDKKAVVMNAPRWDGISSLHGKRMLLLSEGALGDCIQFVRYAHILKQQGAYIILKTLSPLRQLLNLCPYIDEIITHNESTIAVDYYTSLMSLPALLHATIETVPSTIPYIFANTSLHNEWHTKLNHDKKIKVGICWQADTANDANRPPRAQRTISAQAFAPLAQIDPITLYSLQHGQIAPSFMHDFGPELDTTHGRFMDTAAIISNLDLVISVDTSIAHLAGALGIATWLLLPYKADWRWLDAGDTCPWYPNMRIFRQRYDEGWQTVIDRIKQELSNISDTQ